MPHLSSSDSSLVSLDWAVEEGTEQAHLSCLHAYLTALYDLSVTL